MPTLDYAALYEAQIRPRQRLRRMLFNSLIVIVAAIPLAYVCASGLA
jgi:hypothetical protein